MLGRIFLFFLFISFLLAIVLVYLVPLAKRLRNDAEKIYDKEEIYLNPVEDKQSQKDSTAIKKPLKFLPIIIGKKILCKSCKTKKFRPLGKDKGEIVVHKVDCTYFKKLMNNSVEV